MSAPELISKAKTSSEPTRRDRLNIAVARFLDHPTPDRAGARPYRIQCRVARCDMGLPSHNLSSPFASFRVFRGPHSLVRFREEALSQAITSDIESSLARKRRGGFARNRFADPLPSVADPPTHRYADRFPRSPTRRPAVSRPFLPFADPPIRRSADPFLPLADPPTRRFADPFPPLADPPIRRFADPFLPPPTRRYAVSPIRFTRSPTRRPADPPTRFPGRQPELGVAPSLHLKTWD